MTNFARHLLITVVTSFAALVSVGQCGDVAQPQQATVFLADGQVHTAAIDARSNDQRLVLRFESETATVLRRIRWNRVEALRVNGERLNRAEAIARLDGLVSVRAEGVKRDVATGTTASSASETTTQAEQAQQILGASARVQSVAVDAIPASFNADVPVNGLSVLVAPLDRWGQLIAAEGTVEIEIFGNRRSQLRPQPLTRGEQFDRLGRWVVQLDARQLGPSGYVFQLPFEAFNPAETTTIDPRALINIRVSVPGQGVYEASEADIRLLPFSPMRNRIEASTGSRYLPAEATGF